MDLAEAALCLPAVILAGVVGYYIGREQERKRLLGSESGAAMVNINQQLAEIKGKFESIEKARVEHEKHQTILQGERDKSWKQILDNTTANEKGRMEQVQKAVEQVGQFQKLLMGTQSRGSAAEHVLKTYLKDLIKQRLVETDVNVGNNLKVEFAWKLADEKYLPIDCKCHDVQELVKSMTDAQDAEAQKSHRNKIRKKIEGSIDEVRKYQSLPKTIRYCVMAVPDQVYELMPELSSYALSNNVILTSYSNVSVIAYLTAVKYNEDLEKGDAQELEEVVQSLLSIVEKISEKTDTIERGLKTIKNANDEICSEVGKAKKVR